MRDCLGLSVGATNLVAVADRQPVVRPAVLTVYGDRGPEVGTPTGGGLVITGFVDRVGDPVPLVAADGSAHRGEYLLAAAVDAMTRAASPVRRPDATVVAVPAHWRPAAWDAARRALPGIRVVSDAVAALTAIQAYPGLPAHGVVALCDFGATGTSLTLADAGAGFAPIGSTVRHDEFSGDLIDQELLRYVLSTLDTEPSGTAAVAALTQLRAQCRIAKERLSYQSAASLAGPLPGGSLRLTRAELESVVSGPLGGLIDTLLDLLRRNGIHPSQLAALVTVGGGARIPLVTQRLSEAFRMPVTTVPQAQVIAAVGAGLLARRRDDETATRRAVMAPASLTGTVAASALAPAPVAWSMADNVADIAEFVPESLSEDAARPQFVFADVEPEPTIAGKRWYRRGGVVAYAAAFLAVIGTVGLVLSARADRMDATAPSDAVAAAPQPAESPMAQSIPAPPTRTVVVRDPAPAAQVAPQPAAAPRVVQRQQAAPPPAPPAAAPRPAPPAAAPPALPPVPQFPIPPLPVPQLPIPQLPIPTFVPPTQTPTPTPEPTQEPEPTPEPTPEPEPTQEPEPTSEPTQEPEPTQAPETPAPESETAVTSTPPTS